VGVLAGLAGVAIVATSVVSMTGKAVEAYQERRRREREAAIKREQAIQQKIALIRAGVGSSSEAKRVSVKLPDSRTSGVNLHPTTGDSNDTIASDAQRQVQGLRSRLPNIKAEYQALIEQQLLNAQSVQQALQQTEDALNANNLAAAETYLQALDDARIQVIQQARVQWTAQIEYLQERLDELQAHIPQSVNQHLQTRIDKVSNRQQLSEPDIQAVHQLLSEFEAQVDQVQEVADNLVASWHEAGYVTNVLQVDDGDIILEVETHDGANTQMRVQFYGQQIDLEGPHDEEGADSCAGRTMEVMQRFQEQGYQLEWREWNDELVPEELRTLNPVEIPATPRTQSSPSPASNRRLEVQGY